MNNMYSCMYCFCHDNSLTSFFTDIPESKKEELLKSKIALKRFGSTQDIANAAMFIAQADYMHGQVSKNVKLTVTSARCQKRVHQQVPFFRL